MYNRNYEIDMDSVAALLQDAVEKVKTQENPDVLTDLKKVFKKNVPLTLRSYVAAYLAKELNRNFKGGFRPSKRNDRNERNERRNQEKRENNRERKEINNQEQVAEERQPRPRVQIDPAVAATIFISIGRNRRVFPRDLVGLLISVAGLERDRIGDIRVLANYSFVQLFAEDADKAIAALNDYEYRGRKLVVSFSRQKDGEDASQEVTDAQDEQSAEDAAAYAAANRAANNEPFAAPHLSSEDSSGKGDYLV